MGWYGSAHAQAYLSQLVQSLQLRQTVANISDASATESPMARASVAAGTPISRIEIPRLGISAVIDEGDDGSVLDKAVGHIPGTAFPGKKGTSDSLPTAIASFVVFEM